MKRPVTSPGAAMTSVWVGYQFREVTELALNLHPDRRRIVVIDGALGNPGDVQQEVESQLKGLEPKASLTYLRDLLLNDVLARVKDLGRETVRGSSFGEIGFVRPVHSTIVTTRSELRTFHDRSRQSPGRCFRTAG
jgi:hypothetical protein